MAVWLHGQKGVTPATDGIGDGWKASCCGDVFVPDELVPYDLQQLPLTQMPNNGLSHIKDVRLCCHQCWPPHKFHARCKDNDHEAVTNQL